MKEAIVAFAFGVPSSLPSNRKLVEIASRKARELNAPVFTQQDMMPLEPGVEYVLTEEVYPNRVPTLRIARGAAQWAKDGGIRVLWICAAGPHLTRVTRDIKFAIAEVGGAIEIKFCDGIHEAPRDVWFCDGSAQIDTRIGLVWAIRDTILMLMPMVLYSRIAG